LLLGFKRRFAPYVEDDTKTHTIRGKRRIAPRVGETCHCYVDPRQRTMRLLGRFPCVKVDEIVIEGGLGGIAHIYVAGESLSVDEMRSLAWRDGFREPGDSLEQMSVFWESEHDLAPGYAWRGDLIHWRYGGNL